MEYGQLVIWEPLKDNPFDRFKEPMNLVSIHYDGEDLELTFSAFNSGQKFKFTYNQDETNFYAIRHFRILKELTRDDIEILIGKLREEMEVSGLERFATIPLLAK